MRKELPEKAEKYRVNKGPLASIKEYGCNGLFRIPYRKKIKLTVIASNGDGWDHVSVSTEKRCPTWNEMKYIKNLFFKSNETVIQYFPPEIAYVNNCPNCLHMWRKQGHNFELPPTYMV